MAAWLRPLLAALLLVQGVELCQAQVPEPAPPGPYPNQPLIFDQSYPVRDLTPSHLPGGTDPYCTTCFPEEHHAEASQAGAFGWADYLLWKPRRRGLDYALIDPVDNLVPQGSIESLQWETRSGFRAGGGYRFASGWELGTSYTYFRSGDRNSIGAPSGGLLYTTTTRPGLIDEAATAAAETHLGYDLWDVEAARRIELDEAFAVRMGGGVMFASIDQELEAFYNGREANSSATFFRNDFTGVGPYVSGEGQWLLPAGLSLFGRGRGGIVYGEYTDNFGESTNAGAAVLANVTEEFTQMTPMLQVGLGLGWGSEHFHARVGYEVTQWFGLSERPYAYDDFSEGRFSNRPGDLSLGGLFIQLGMTF
jgi:hypothetical protein